MSIISWCSVTTMTAAITAATGSKAELYTGWYLQCGSLQLACLQQSRQHNSGSMC
jgi:hypothetical protein